MNHFIYTVDIATVRPLTTAQQHELTMRFDAVLETHPVEFEDWKISTKNEERAL